MRSKITQKILDDTPEYVKIEVRTYGNLVMRIHEILAEKGINQATLAASMDKKPSEISKWLGGEHNFTLRSIAKLEAELGVELLSVTSKEKTATNSNFVFSNVQKTPTKKPTDDSFLKIAYSNISQNNEVKVLQKPLYSR
jgi:transcriptional regulator with XRE-family HTH domain